MKSLKLLQHNEGFTIIETLVAITILMISITGPLTVAHKALLAATYAQDQVTASYLAQDAMEYLKNIKDHNIIQYGALGWLTTMGSCQSYCFVDTINYSTSGSSNGVSLCSSDSPPTPPTETACKLGKNDNGYGRVDGSAPTTKFSRYFYWQQTPYTYPTDEVKLVVIVSWKSGVIDNIVKYESNIFDVVR